MFVFLILLTYFCGTYQQNINNEKQILKILLITQEGQDSICDTINEITNNTIHSSQNIETEFIQYEIHSKSNTTIIISELCQFYEQGVNIMFDFTWSNEYMNIIYNYTQKLKISYFTIDLYLSSNLKIVESYLIARNATDVTFIFENNENMANAFNYFINKDTIRITMLNGMIKETYQRINETNFIPSFYVIIANTENITTIVKSLQSTKLMRFPERLVLSFLDIDNINQVKNLTNGKPISLITYDKKICCKDNCMNCPNNFNLQKQFLNKFIKQIIKIIANLNNNGLEIISNVRNCTTPSKFPTKLFYEYLSTTQQNVYMIDKNLIFSPQLDAIIELGKKNKNYILLGKYNYIQGFVLEPGLVIKPNKKFYRVATGIATPWIYREKDPDTGMIRLAGYCIDFIDKLAEIMNFDYELGVTDGFYGVKQPDGSWNGLIGGLINGQIDIVVAPMTMTAEREEVVDFVTPIFATTGITIVTRKPVKKSSLFKFLTVLDIQVWLMVMVALVITGLMLFVLEYFSPFSARNKKYPHQCREFNIIECFWFALTSFTPQGGGEPPMSLSGRILVGAYWIFVVLLLATFTANLSAFLTVERMQLQVPEYTLDQLIRQSRINYTVIKGSWPQAYFQNMRNTENQLYELWRSLALNASTDKYRVWDYPIKEVYGNVLKAIHEAVPVANVSEGYRKVLEHTDGDYAFIHDYSEIRFAIARTCYLVEVGKPFAERPYAVAVQQGSALLEDVGKAMQNLQREGYFDFLKHKYWEANLRGECPDDDTDDGITVDSLGGAFIATIAVLLLAIISLIIEIFNIRGICCKEENQIAPEQKKENLFSRKERNEISTKAQNKSLALFKPQIEILEKSHLQTEGYNYKNVSVIRGNYFTGSSRKDLNIDKEARKRNVFLN